MMAQEGTGVQGPGCTQGREGFRAPCEAACLPALEPTVQEGAYRQGWHDTGGGERGEGSPLVARHPGAALLPASLLLLCAHPLHSYSFLGGDPYLG